MHEVSLTTATEADRIATRRCRSGGHALHFGQFHLLSSHFFSHSEATDDLIGRAVWFSTMSFDGAHAPIVSLQRGRYIREKADAVGVAVCPGVHGEDSTRALVGR